MSLNIATTSVYDLTLPASKKKVKFRPFVVKEEKILMIGMQEGGDNILTAMIKVLNDCTFNAIKVEQLPTADAEFLFMHVRNKAMGEGIELIATCTSCEHKNIIMADMSRLTVTPGPASMNVELRPGLIITMKFPTLQMTNGMSEDSDQSAIETVAKSIEFISDGDTVHDAAEHTLKDMIDFVENLTQGQMKKIEDFFETIPKVKFEMNYSCTKCRNENQVLIEGIEDFFA